MDRVVVTVTGRTTGTWWTCPYNHVDHADFSVAYEVPTYEVFVGEGLHRAAFEAVRFGLVRRNGTAEPPATRVCDAGLADQQTVTPTWHPSYSPGSFEGSRPVGAWRLYPNGGWMIHEGTDIKERLSSSLGCIEIVGPGAWRRFLETLKTKAGADCSTIGRKRLLKVVIQKAVRPTAARV